MDKIVHNETTIRDYLGKTRAEVEKVEASKGRRVIEEHEDETCRFLSDRVRIRLDRQGRVIDARVG